MRWLLTLPLLLLAGCPKAPTNPTALVTAAWTGNGTPGIPNCTTNPPPCFDHYVISAPGIVDNVAMTVLTYSTKNVPVGTATVTLAVVMKTASGGTVTSPAASQVVTVK